MKKLAFILSFMMVLYSCTTQDDTVPSIFAPEIDINLIISSLPGTTYTINGANLDNNPTVSLSGKNLTISNNTENSLEFEIPANAGSGELTITINGEFEFSRTSFLKILDPNFTQQDFNFSEIGDIDFLNENIGFASANGNVYKTTNAGTNWEVIYTNNGVNSSSTLSISDDSNIWVKIGNAPLDYAITNDGGASWTEIDAVPTLHLANRLFSSNTDKVFVMTESDGNGFIFSSTDNGQTWLEVYTTANSTLFKSKVAFNSEGVIYIANAKNNFLLKTFDNGISWSESTLNLDLNEISEGAIFFIDQNVGWAYNEPRINGKTPGLYKTTDGGTTWELKTVNNLFPFNLEESVVDIQFIDANRGIATTQQGGYIITEDGGENWKLFYLDINNTTRFADFSPGNAYYFSNASIIKKAF